MASRFQTALFTLALSCFAVSIPAKAAPNSATETYEASSNELFKKHAPAVVKIVTRLHGVPVLTGTGFFVSDDGVVMTNRHVLKNAIHDKNFTAEFVLRDKRVVKDFQVGHCSDEKQVDLCLVKLPIKSKSFFKISSQKPGENDPSYIIGHPRGMDFTIAYGLVKAYRPTALGSELVEVSTPMGPGSSGAPLFDNHGRIIGVASMYSSNQVNGNFGVPLSEVARFLDEAVSYLPLREARARFNEYMQAAMSAKRETEVEPALVEAQKGLSLNGTKDFLERDFEFGSRTLSVAVPKIFENCIQQRKKEAAEIYHACFGLGDSVVFTLQRFAAPKTPFASLNKKSLLPPKPLEVVRQLTHNGSWKAIEAKLPMAARADFRSGSEPAKCADLPVIKSGSFSRATYCQFKVLNDQEPAATSFNLWVKQDEFVYGYSVWLKDSSLSEYFTKIPLLAALTTHGTEPETRQLAASTKVLQDKKLASYEIELPEPFAFVGSKLKDGLQYDFYAEKSGKIGDFPLYSVTESNETILPPSYDSAAKNLTMEAARMSGITISPAALALSPIEVETSAARLTSGVGRDKRGRGIVIMGCVIYGKDLSHVITKATVSTDPMASFKSFKSVCLDFKRK